MSDLSGNIREWGGVDFEQFHKEIVPLGQPAVIRGLAEDWPAVRAGKESLGSICNYLSQFDSGVKVAAMVAPESTGGRFFYRDDFKGFNYETKSPSLTETLTYLSSLENESSPPSVAVQGLLVSDVLPGFSDVNSTDFMNPATAATAWIGNSATVSTHFDYHENLAFVVSGRRKFTLFPPDQLNNLYVGPLLTTPARVPVSMVDIKNPDFSCYPRFADAQASAQVAYLEPGDAIFIPYMWWHNVESIGPLNMLVNYFWTESNTNLSEPILSLMHSKLSISKLSRSQKIIWRNMFNHLVFDVDEDPVKHLPKDLEDILLGLSGQGKKQLKAWLVKQMEYL